MFDKILIANRGEIAVRVIKTCKEMGIQTVAVYSDADARALHVILADEAHRIGEPPSAKSYLLMDRVLEVARRSGAQAIHPGYGFLAENTEFSARCEEAGITFIGPPASAIIAMGDKIQANETMRSAGVPTIQDSGAVGTLEAAREAAQQIGYPVLLKASAGGGGIGMRLVEAEEDLKGMYEKVRSEAASYFGNDAVTVQRYLQNARHVEVQVLADRHGNGVALGERDCSVQRRYQKIIEETPATVLDLRPGLRQRMWDSAVRGALRVGYVNAGTVEFLVSGDAFYFLEMNTRLQVEHPVTEMVTGIDIVREQIRIAAGAPLDPALSELKPMGHSIECRVYAEDPAKHFFPSAGRISRLQLPTGPWVRNDCGVGEGEEVSVYYTPLLSKVITWGRTREEAIRRMEVALAEFRVDGVMTNVPYLRQILAQDDYRRGEFDVKYIERRHDALVQGAMQAADRSVQAGGLEPEVAVAVTAAIDRILHRGGHFAEGPLHDGSIDPWTLEGRRMAMRGSLPASWW